MKLAIKILNENVREHFEKYIENFDGNTDSGLDLPLPETTFVESNKVTFLRLGVACEVVDSKFVHGYDLVPRSSMSVTPLRLANSIGIIDFGYRGEIMAAVDGSLYLCDNCFQNHKCYGPTRCEEGCYRKDYINGYEVEAGTRLFQLVAPDRRPIEIVLVEELSDSKRGEKGFGSSGKK